MQTPLPSTDQSHCPWCGAALESESLSCPGCGAPVHARIRASDSGWVEQPAIKDMARLRIGASTCQIEGLYVPVADFNLAAGDSVYFAHHVLLWKDVSVEIRRMKIAGALNRMFSGMPLVMTEAHGPGHIAFSRDEPGEMIALPLQPGQSVDVLEHLFLAATHSVGYHYLATGVWFQTRRDKDTETHYPIGQFLDRFSAQDQPGVLLIHASGNVFVRDLAEGQTLLIKPRSLLYKDPSVFMALKFEVPSGSTWTWHRLMWLHLTGPGRVAIQSAYEPAEDPGTTLCGHSWAPAPAAGVTAQRRVNQAMGRAPLLPTASSQSPGSFGAAQPSSPPAHTDPRHAMIAQMVARAYQAGAIDPAAMSRIVEAARAQGLSEYDVRLIVKHFHSHGN